MANSQSISERVAALPSCNKRRLQPDDESEDASDVLVAGDPSSLTGITIFFEWTELLLNNAMSMKSIRFNVFLCLCTSCTDLGALMGQSFELMSPKKIYRRRPPYFPNKIIRGILERETKILNYSFDLSTNCWGGIGLYITCVVQDDQRLVASIHSAPALKIRWGVVVVQNSSSGANIIRDERLVFVGGFDPP